MSNNSVSKKLLSKIFCCCLISFVLLSGCFKQNKESAQKTTFENTNIVDKIKQKGVVTVVTNAVFPPFEYFNYNNIEGIDIDISQEIAKDLGVKLEILEMNFDGVIAAISSGKGDFIAAGLTKDPKREKAISFSDEYITVPQSLIVLNKGEKDEQVFENLSTDEVHRLLLGKRIGVQIGTTSSKYVKEQIENGFLKNSCSDVIEKKEYLDLVTDLRNNRIDVIALDGLIARQLAKKNKDLICFDRETEKYVLAVKKGNEELLKYINQTINRLIDENKIQDFYNKHYALD